MSRLGESATGQVHEVLRRSILDGELAPGASISQLELVRRYSVGRTPVREALRLLEREGLVIVRGPRDPVTISALSMEDLDELYSLRVLGEGLALWMTVPVLGVTDLEMLLCDATQAADGDPHAHMRFHARLRRGAGPRLREHLERLFEHSTRYQRAFAGRGTRLSAHTVEEHQQIIDACLAGDRSRASRALVDHIAATALALMASEEHAPVALQTALATARVQTDR